MLSYGIFGSSSKNELSSNLKEDTANQSLKSNKPDSCYSNMNKKLAFFSESNDESDKRPPKKIY